MGPSSGPPLARKDTPSAMAAAPPIPLSTPGTEHSVGSGKQRLTDDMLWGMGCCLQEVEGQTFPLKETGRGGQCSIE